MSHDIFEPEIDKYPADIGDVVDNYLLHFLKISVLKQRLARIANSVTIHFGDQVLRSAVIEGQ